ncbi:endothelial cell-selective adhesion molecule [Tachyglossus aculeatus]|uniref:endothelial cell-selective adhesion molecule n=1 Tax=Tachyglossus aculeatus TaxID=9261 RepID=UPI0018F38672|nr:endothelial cell-selective adhesion molecule [Tachyglossus aculeatus]
MDPHPSPPRPRAPRFLFPLLGLGLTLLAPSAGTKMTIHMGRPLVEAVEGQGAVLPAWYTLSGGPAPGGEEVPVVIWFLQRPYNGSLQLLTYINKVLTPFDARVSLAHPMPSRNVSLKLRDLREYDSGEYGCSVNLPGVEALEGISTLKLNVLVPPTTPSCRLLSTPRLGANVTLNCSSTRSKPSPQYQWERSSPAPQVFFPPAQDSVRGSLTLTNLSAAMSGVYICTAANQLGSAQCNLTLEVIPEPGVAMVTGAVVGTAIGLGLLAGLALLYGRRKKAQDEPANDIKEDASAPRTLPWPKGSDTLSKNGTLSSVTSARALRPPHGPANPRPGTFTPTPSLSSQALMPPGPPRTVGPRPPSATPTSSLAPAPAPAPTPTPASALTRMGAVPVMVPAQSQAGSLV